MRKGINLWSLGWPKLTKTMSNADLGHVIKKMGYDGIELTFDDDEVDPTKLSEAEVKEIALSFRSQGLEIPSVASGTFWAYNLGASEDSIRRRGIDFAKACITRARTVGAESLLVVPAVASPKIQYDELYRNSLKSVTEIAKFAQQYRVTVAVENVWNKFLYSPTEFSKFLSDTGMPNVKAYLDPANLMAISYPENWIDVLKGRISNVHAKDFDTSIGNISAFRHLLKGSIDWNRITKLLKDNGYDGYLMLECPPDFDPSIIKPSMTDALTKAEENSKALDSIIASIGP